MIRWGDVVWLKSGGPAMLVVDLHRTRVVCSWDADEGPEEFEFHPAQLTHTITPEARR